jgi:hypothetical protein
MGLSKAWRALSLENLLGATSMDPCGRWTVGAIERPLVLVLSYQFDFDLFSVLLMTANLPF